MSHLTPLFVIVLAYFIGAIPFGYLVARARGVNIFDKGSGNIGATNVGRILGYRFGVLVFLLDFAKGAIPVAVAGRLGQVADLDWLPDSVRVLAGLAAFLGHLFPVYLGFRGGKGVATAAGVTSVLLPLPMAAALLVWIAVAVSFRMISLASLAAALFLCGWRLMVPGPFTRENLVLTWFCVLVTALVFVRHRSNLVRLVHGTENQLREKPIMIKATRILHVLSLGLWFGLSVFFNFAVGLSVFGTFWNIGKLDSSQRPSWFPAAPMYERDPELWRKESSNALPFNTSEEVRREQGTRAAGAAVGPLLTIYFAVSGFCGLLALVTSLGWSAQDPSTRVHRLRAWFLIAALLTVLLGWPLERKVAAVNAERNTAIDNLLASDNPNAKLIDAATNAKQAFTTWHSASLGLSLLGVVLVTIAMALAAWMPVASVTPAKSGLAVGERGA
jgi:acyl-phosphate glycerol 3-phosphate acyltransferase